MGMAVQSSPVKKSELLREPSLAFLDMEKFSRGEITFSFGSAPENRLVAFLLWLSYSQWVVSYILCYITFKFDKVCLVCLLVHHLWAVAGPAVEGGSHNKTSSEGLTCSLAAQDQVPSAWHALMGLCLRCKAPELLWIWDGQRATQTPVGEYHPLFSRKSTLSLPLKPSLCWAEDKVWIAVSFSEII